MNPRVSAITPVYNRIDFFKKTLYSVLSQQRGCHISDSLEYIVVDDGSTDGTYEWLLSLDFQNLRVLTHAGHRNCGQAASVNVGMAHAKGEFIVILDSDDMLAQGAIDAHIRFLERDTSLGMVYGQGYAIDTDDEKLYPLFPESHLELNNPNLLLLDNYIASPGLCMFRKSVIEKVGPLEESFRASQDHDFLLRIAEVSRLEYSRYVCFSTESMTIRLASMVKLLAGRMDLKF